MNRTRSSYDERRSRRQVNNKVPAGWLDYSSLNTWVENTRIVPFKCPLRWSILRNIDEKDRFSLDDLVERLAQQGRKIGLIIDLTDTYRYYDSRDVEDMGIEYCKIRVPGHQDVSYRNFRKFFRTVQNFLRNNEHNNHLIGVHCTHGINRSGYFIVRYLIEIRGEQPDDAIAAFNRARGHDMEKYIDELRKRKPFSISSSMSSDEQDSDYGIERDRPLPYSRPSTDRSTNAISSEK